MVDSSFDFSGDAAAGYDEVLVPALFEPWARRLIDDHQPWGRRSVLDLATGTGVVLGLLGPETGSDARLYGVDVNPDMLTQARRRCSGSQAPVELMNCPAEELPLPDDAVDFVVCQQGFQFFTDRPAAAREIKRVLRTGGKAVVTTWLPVSDCQFFGAICEALEEVGEPSIAELMRIPFDHLPGGELRGPFDAAGFQGVHLERQTMGLDLEFGRVAAFAYATPIGPRLRDLSAETQAEFRARLSRRASEIASGDTMGQMASHVLTASVDPT